VKNFINAEPVLKQLDKKRRFETGSNGGNKWTNPYLLLE
jgi:hypothetical protein